MSGRRHSRFPSEQGQEDRNVRPPEPVEKDRQGVAAKHLDARWLAAQRVVLGSGMRWGELARMKLDDLKPRGIIIQPRPRCRQGSNRSRSQNRGEYRPQGRCLMAAPASPCDGSQAGDESFVVLVERDEPSATAVP